MPALRRPPPGQAPALLPSLEPTALPNHTANASAPAPALFGDDPTSASLLGWLAALTGGAAALPAHPNGTAAAVVARVGAQYTRYVAALALALNGSRGARAPRWRGGGPRP